MLAQEQAGVQTAGFPERLVAGIIDAVIIGVPLGILSLILPQALYFIIAVAGGAGYTIYFWTTSGATLGKMAMGLKVVNAETGATLDTGTAVLRYLGYMVSSIPLYLGFLWIIWDPKKEGWHDKIAKTRVIKAK